MVVWLNPCNPEPNNFQWHSMDLQWWKRRGEKCYAHYLLFNLAYVTRCEHKGINQWCDGSHAIWFVLTWARGDWSEGSCWGGGGRKHCSACFILKKKEPTVMLSAAKAPQDPATSFNQLKNVPGFLCGCLRVCFCMPLPFFAFHLSFSEVLEIY